MTLHTEIDQDVKCPVCGRELVIYDSGDGYCPSVACSERKFVPKHVAALRNQLPPGHVAIPTHDLEALRYEVGRYGSDRSDVIGAAQEVLRHLPAKVDHVAELRRILNGYRSVHGTDRQRAALEAAIKEMEKP